jgi:ribosomal protection tetracycline resistance protein
VLSLNLGIVAHVDAGKTTLTERLLFEAGVTDHVGRVDHGDTTTDADALERSRGITIRSAVVAFDVERPGGETVHVHLVDTPGHADFVGEVERALAVLDAAVLVVSAVEGVQARTRVLIRILERLGIPFLVFANKVDRAGASYDATMAALREALTGGAVALVEPSEVGTRACAVRRRAGAAFRQELAETLADHDDRLLERWLGDGLSDDDTTRALARLTAGGAVHPVLFGAALLGLGTAEVLEAVAALLPTAPRRVTEGLHARVFKIERDAGGRRTAYVRLDSGHLDARDHVTVHRRGRTGSVTSSAARATAVRPFTRGAGTEARRAQAGEIALVSGLGDVAIGDQLGWWDPHRGARHFPPPGREAVVRPRDPADRVRLFAALQELSAQDPLIDARLDGPDDEVTVSVYGEVQKEVLAARLEVEHGVPVTFLPTRTVYVERVAGVAEAHRVVRTGNASVGLRVEPGAPGGGTSYAVTVERGYLLPSHHTAVEAAVARALEQGPLGWRVVDARVTLVAGHFNAPTPPAGYYRELTAAAVAEALRTAGTTACAPVSAFEVEMPTDVLSAVLQALVRAGARPGPPRAGGRLCRVTGTVPSDAVDDLEHRLSGLTRGEGLLVVEPAGFEPVRGRLRTAPRRGPGGP